MKTLFSGIDILSPPVSAWRSQCVVLGRLIALSLAVLGLAKAQSSRNALDFVISQEVAPSDATAQIKLFLRTPQPISGGDVWFTFNGSGYPAAQPAVAASSVFSAAGDAQAVGKIDSALGSYKFEVLFNSPSAGIGRVPGLPVVEFSIPVGTGFSVGLDLDHSSFYGPSGAYSANVQVGGAVVGGNLSIQSITPPSSMGPLPKGSVLQIKGLGFVNGTTVRIDGVSTGAVSVQLPNLINVVLTGATELAGKHLLVSNSNGKIDYWFGLDTGTYTFPLSAASSVTTSEGLNQISHAKVLVVHNPGSAPAGLLISNALTGTGANTKVSDIFVSVPPNGIYTTFLNPSPGAAGSTLRNTATTMVQTFVYVLEPNTGYLWGLYPLQNQSQQPALGSILNAATQQSGNVSPGEIITLFGSGLGPDAGVPLSLDSTRKVPTTLGGVRVLFDGVPAPLLYASGSQINAIVPYEIAVNRATQVQLEYNAAKTAAWDVPAAAVSPGVFTQTSSGVGQGAILNQDNSTNTKSNPAQRGSIIQIYATGEGITSPSASTGDVTPTGQSREPVSPVKITIGGADADVLFAGAAPGAVSGLLQINARVPQILTPGNELPLVIQIGNTLSPAGVTISVQ